MKDRGGLGTGPPALDPSTAGQEIYSGRDFEMPW